MTTDVIDAEVVGTDIERAEPQTLNLFGATTAEAVLDRAVSIADALAQVIEQKQLFTMISGRKHVRVEGWQTLGSMLGVVAVITHTAPITDDQGNTGWEARCEARTLSGAVVGAADSHCSRAERTWKSRDDYAIRSMAQTRAVSKALRGPLGFVMELAGFSATPEEEMPGAYVRPAWLQSLVTEHGEDKVLAVARQLWPQHSIWNVDNLADVPEEHRPTFSKALASGQDPQVSAPKNSWAEEETEGSAAPESRPSSSSDWDALGEQHGKAAVLKLAYDTAHDLKVSPLPATFDDLAMIKDTRVLEATKVLLAERQPA